jgi:hypothetical protein
MLIFAEGEKPEKNPQKNNQLFYPHDTKKFLLLSGTLI